MVSTGVSAWFDAIEKGSLRKITALVEKYGCSRDENGDTGLLRAVRAGNVDVVKILLVKEANMVNREGMSALLIAARLDNVESALALIKATSDQTSPEGMNALMVAAAAGSLKTAKAIIRYFKDVPDDNGLYALDHAVSSGMLDMVQLICCTFPQQMPTIVRSLQTARSVSYTEIASYLEELSQTCAAYGNGTQNLAITALRLPIQQASLALNPISMAGSQHYDTKPGIISDMRDQLSIMNASISRLTEPNSVSESSVLSAMLLSTGGGVADCWSSLGVSPHGLDTLAGGGGVIATDGDTVITTTDLINQLHVLQNELTQRNMKLNAQEREVDSLKRQLQNMGYNGVVSPGSAQNGQATGEEALVADIKRHINELTSTADTLALRYIKSKREEQQFGQTTLGTYPQLADDMTRLNDYSDEALVALNVLRPSPHSGEPGSGQALRNIKDAELTPMMRAIIAGQGVDPGAVKAHAGARLSDGTTALMLAVQYGNISAVTALSKPEARMARADGVTALALAIQQDFSDAINILLPYEGIDISSTDNIAIDGQKSLLMSAVEKNDLVSVYCCRKIFSRLHDDNGQTALMYAAQYGRVKALDLLLSYEQRMQTPDGITALMIAAQYGQIDCIRKLLPYENDMIDMFGQNALYYATKLAKYSDKGLEQCLVALLADDSKDFHTECED